MDMDKRKRVVEAVLDVVGGVVLFALAALIFIVVMAATDYHWC